MRAPPNTFAHARRLRREMTRPEVQLWKVLRGSQLNGTRVRRQHPVGPYVLDVLDAERRATIIDTIAALIEAT